MTTTISMYDAIYKHKIRMSARPEFYSGRGATLGDLNSDILEQFHKVITQEVNANAAKAFVNMVADMKSLSATAFLNRLYMLEGNGFRFYPTEQRKSEDIDVGPDDEGRLAVSLFTIAAAMFPREDQTESIRASFIRNHLDELTPDLKKKMEERPKENAYDMMGRRRRY